jgi:hypothetical protein
MKRKACFEVYPVKVEVLDPDTQELSEPHTEYCWRFRGADGWIIHAQGRKGITTREDAHEAIKNFMGDLNLNRNYATGSIVDIKDAA